MYNMESFILLRELMFQEQPHIGTMAASSTPTAITAGIFTLAGLGLAGAAYGGYHFLKKWLETPAKLSELDIKKYHNLISAYKQVNSDLPDEWKITEDYRPTFVLHYPLAMSSLNNYINKLTSENSGLDFAHASILSLIKVYLENIEERNWYEDHLYQAYDRPNGVEAMFLAEMIRWLTNDFPNTHILSPEIIAEFKKRVVYCKEIQFYLSKNNHLDKKRANFKDMLKELINELDEYHSYLNQRFEAANFNDLINRLSDNILGICAHSFNTLYLLINGADQSRLIVKQFLNPPKSNVEMQSVRDKELGKWLYRTLTLAGVNANTFESTKMLSLDKIKHHLDGEHPTDKVCKLPSNLRNITSEKWGHWPFVTQPVPLPASTQGSTRHTDRLFSRGSTKVSASKNAEGYLTFIREISRLILEFYFIRTNLLRAATVACVEGEKWIYGDKVGKAALDALLATVLEDVEEYKNTFEAFWTTYFHHHYNSYSVLKNEDDISHPSHKWLNTIDQQSKVFINNALKKVEDLITKIRLNALRLPDSEEKVQRTKIAMFSDIVAILEHKNKTHSANYKTLNDELSLLKTGKQVKAVDNEDEINMARSEAETIIASTIREEIDAEVNYFMINWQNNHKSESDNPSENKSPDVIKNPNENSNTFFMPASTTTILDENRLNEIRKSELDERIATRVSEVCQKLYPDSTLKTEHVDIYPNASKLPSSMDVNTANSNPQRLGEKLIGDISTHKNDLEHRISQLESSFKV